MPPFWQAWLPASLVFSNKLISVIGGDFSASCDLANQHQHGDFLRSAACLSLTRENRICNLFRTALIHATAREMATFWVCIHPGITGQAHEVFNKIATLLLRCLVVQFIN